MSSDDESSTLERRLASKLVEKLSITSQQTEVDSTKSNQPSPKHPLLLKNAQVHQVFINARPDIEPEVTAEPEKINPFTEEHKRSLIQSKVDLILKVNHS